MNHSQCLSPEDYLYKTCGKSFSQADDCFKFVKSSYVSTSLFNFFSFFEM